MSENALFYAVDWRRYRRQVDRKSQPYYIRPPSPAGAMRSIATRIVGLTLAVNLGVNLGVRHGQLCPGYRHASYDTASVACRGIKEEAAGVAMVREIEHVAQTAGKRVK